MAHFAQIDSNNVVTRVIVAEKNFINSGHVGDEFTWIQTSYNENFRGKFAGVGDTWDPVKQVFLPPQPYPSWTLNSQNKWEPPVAKPADSGYVWNENTQTWDARL